MDGKVIALRCWSSDSNYNADFDYGIVSVTKKLVSLVEKRRKMFMDAQALDSDLTSIQFFDYSTEYCAESDLEDWAQDRLDEGEDLPGWFKSLTNGGSEQEIPADFSFEDQDGDFNYRPGLMVVMEYGVSWKATPKHSDITVTTDELRYITLASCSLALAGDAQEVTQ